MDGAMRTETLRGGVLLCALLLLFARVPFFSEPPGMDQSLFALIAEQMLDGRALYTEVFDHKPPAAIFPFVLLRALFPPEGWVYAMVDLVLVLGQLLLVVHVLRRSFDDRCALFGAALFTFLALCPIWGGKIAFCQSEVMANCLLLVAMALCVAEARPGPRVAAGLGLIAAALLSIKILPVILLLPALALTRAPGPGERVRQIAWGAAGFVVGLLPTLLYLAWTGTWAAFRDAMVVFNPVYAAAWVNPLLPSLGEKLYALALPTLLGLYGLGRHRGRGRRELLAFAAWGAGAFLMLVAQRKYFYYHFLVLLPPLALVGAVGAARLAAFLGEGRGRSRRAWLCLLVVVLGAEGWALGARSLQAHGNFLRNRFFHDRPVDFAKAIQVSYGYRLLPTRLIAERIRLWTKKDDEIMVWGMNPLLYVLARRRPCTRYAFHQYLFTDEPISRIYGDWRARRRELLETFRRRPPACFVCARHDRSVFETRDSWEQLEAFPQLLALIRRDYVLALRARNVYLWVRRDRKPDSLDG